MKDEHNELFEVLCGTYEEYLLGYKLIETNEDFKLVQTIANHSHRASVRCVAAHKNHLASGGADENIHLYNIKERHEAGILMHHTGTVTSLVFTPNGSHLLSGGEDGILAVLKVGSWVLEKIWTKPHKGEAVNAISIHPSGKLALSVGADKTLRTWNLIKGRPAYTVNLSSKCKRLEIIKWSCCGEFFALVNDHVLDVYSVANAAVEKSIALNHRITCIEFLEGNKICLGDWAGNVTCYNFLTGDEQWKLGSTEEIRVKSLSHYSKWLVTGNSQGKITVYNIATHKPILVTSVDTSCRITCLTLSHLSDSQNEESFNKKKRKKNKNKQHKSDVTIVNEDQPPSKVFCSPSNQKWKITDLVTRNKE